MHSSLTFISLLVALHLALSQSAAAALAPEMINTYFARPVPGLPENGAAVLKAAEGVIRTLREFKISVDANVNVTIDPAIAGQLKQAADAAIGALNSQIEDLRAVLNEQINNPLGELGLKAQELGRQLNSAVVRANLILSEQQKSLLLSSQTLISGLQTIALDLKNPLNPFKQEEDPRVYHFQFTSSLPSSVPSSGGRLTVVGYNLWEHKAPEIELLTERREPLVKLTSEKAQDRNSVSTVVDSRVISNHLGKPLQLHIRAFKRKWFLFIPIGTAKYDLYLNFVVPPQYTTEVQVDGFIQYDTRVPDPERDMLLDSNKFWRWDNADCDRDKILVSQAITWPVPEGYRIVNWKMHNQEYKVTHATDIKLHITSRDTITASGNLEGPRCANLLFDKKLLEVSVWSQCVIPVISGVMIEPRQFGGSTRSKLQSDGETIISIDIPKPNRSDTTVFWFMITPVVNGQKLLTSYSSARTTVGKTEGSSPLEIAGDYAVEAMLSPVPVNGMANLRVKIEQKQF